MNVKIQIVNDQKNIIKRNRLVTSGSDTIPELKELIVYYQKELFALADQSSKLTIKRDLLQQLITKNDTRLSELLQYDPRLGKPMPKQKAKHQLEVTLYAEKAGQSDIEVSYLVSNAGWYPAYDLRVEETDAPINFTYKGYVYQRTGEDWENVKLSLVTYDDRISTEKPTLHEWVLKYYIPRVYKSKKEVQAYASDYSSQLSNIAQPSMAASEFKSLESIQMNFEEAVEEPIEVIITDKPIVVNNTSESLASFSFDIKLPYSIKSDGEEVLMIINDYKIDAEYTHYIVPKLNTSAFLLASIPDWESLNMLPGKTNLFLGKTYLGNTILNTSTMDDTLNVSLGTDQSIYCTRKKVKDSKKCKIIGSKKYQEITIEIIVKNNKNSKVNMVIEDQIPITMNPEEIAIELLHKNGAKHELSSGKLIWDFELKPQEKKKIKFTYSLKYDKRKKVI